MYIVGFNGPPHCGKDTIANALTGAIRARGYQIQTQREALSLPMRKVAFELLGLVYNPTYYENQKDESQPILKGDSIRQLIIKLSEQFIKPTYGQNFWARRLLLHAMPELANHNKLLIVSDIGFQAECDEFDLVADGGFLTVQLQREGTDWSKDSRGYCHGSLHVTVENNETIFEAADHVVSAMIRLGWNLE